MLQTLPSRRADPSGSAPPVSGAYKVDISRGERIGRVSSEWFSRPDDERYLSLTELHAAVRGRAERATARTVETKALRVEASRDDAQRLTLVVPGRDEPVSPTHWSYGQLCSLIGAPASYMRQLPAPLAGINLQHGLLSHRAELVKTLEADDGRIELRAVTGPDYGRIWDHELVEAVMRIAGNGTGDTRWKVPGLLDWASMSEKLNEQTDAVRTEGWKWIEAAPDFPYGHSYGLRQLRGDPVAPTPEEEAALAALQQEADDIETASAEIGELTDEQDQRTAEIETAIEAITGKPLVYDADEIARAGAFVSIAPDGGLRVERGFVRPEDELPIAPEPEVETLSEERIADNDDDRPVDAGDAGIVTVSDPVPDPEEDEGIKPLSDRLVTELTAHRTLALRQALGERPEVAFLAALHALCLQVFYLRGAAGLPWRAEQLHAARRARRRARARLPRSDDRSAAAPTRGVTKHGTPGPVRPAAIVGVSVMAGSTVPIEDAAAAVAPPSATAP